MAKLGLFCARKVQEGVLKVPKPAPWNKHLGCTPPSPAGYDSAPSHKPRKKKSKRLAALHRELLRHYENHGDPQ
jgi:hypothetical protein